MATGGGSSSTPASTDGVPAWKSWGQVLRLSLAPSAAADVAAGIVLGATAWPAAGALPFLAIVGSLCVYHGGMALNDWADRDEDARVRPERPLPSGRVRPSAALCAAVVLLISGPIAAAISSPWSGATLALVAALAALYDVAGRGPWRGPLLLGLCRFGNVAVGLFAGAQLSGLTVGATQLVFPAIYALYVLLLSILGRTEDDPTREPGALPPRILHLCSLALVAAPIAAALTVGRSDGLLGPAGAWSGIALAVWAALGLQRAAARPGPWTRSEVPPVMGLLLRRLLILTASAVLASGAPGSLPVALLILTGYGISHQLRRVFPPS